MELEVLIHRSTDPLIHRSTDPPMSTQKYGVPTRVHGSDPASAARALLQLVKRARGGRIPRIYSCMRAESYDSQGKITRTVSNRASYAECGFFAPTTRASRKNKNKNKYWIQYQLCILTLACICAYSGWKSCSCPNPWFSHDTTKCAK